ncbi:hypothetical protein AAIB46_21170 [Streptomyces sp. 35M1]|uniref:hypothetical protein n=1 Tax=Streptomyces sp. 35M1 TaxID=3142978 RepID=UPI0039906BA7
MARSGARGTGQARSCRGRTLPLLLVDSFLGATAAIVALVRPGTIAPYRAAPVPEAEPPKVAAD